MLRGSANLRVSPPRVLCVRQVILFSDGGQFLDCAGDPPHRENLALKLFAAPLVAPLDLRGAHEKRNEFFEAAVVRQQPAFSEQRCIRLAAAVRLGDLFTRHLQVMESMADDRMISNWMNTSQSDFACNAKLCAHCSRAGCGPAAAGAAGSGGI